jgi:hypothetical protein
MRKTPFIIVLGIFLCAISLFWRGYRRLSSIEEKIRASEARTAARNQSIEQLRTEIASSRRAAESERSARNRAVALLSAERAAHTVGASDPAWAEPPANWPEWEGESPFVWIPKDVLKQLPIVPFEPNGALNPGVASILAFTPEQTRQMNAELGRTVQAYEQMEVQHARASTNHLFGIRDGPGERVTIVLEPDEQASSRLQNQFEEILRSRSQSRQQYDILHELSRSWVNDHLRPDSPEPITFSAVRHPDGAYGVAIKRGYSWSSMSGVSRLDMYLPAHLMPFFAKLVPADPAGVEEPAN